VDAEAFPCELTHVLEGAGERSLIVEDRAVGTVVLAWPWDANDELLAPLRATYPDIEFVAMPFYGRYTFLEPGSEDVFDEDALALWARADAVMAFDVPKELASLAPRLRWIQAIGAGVNHLFESDLPEEVVITSASGMGATAIAEFVIGRLLSAWKRFPQLDAHQRDRQWEPEFGRLVDGLTLGIIGLGAIGRAIAVRARPFGLQVIGTRRTFRSGDTDPDVDELFGSDDLMAVLPRCDAVVGCLPGTPDTENVFDAGAFAAMPPGSIFCNVGRGSSVDEAALIGALERGHLGAAILDVTRAEPLPNDDPLWRAPNLLLSPHCSVSQDRYSERLVGLLGDNLGRLLRGDELVNSVDTGTRY
jgi:phosphoglycerate dehydrogenase-like enzyme